MHDAPPFYGKKVNRKKEQALINEILAKYKDEEVTDELHKKIYDELHWEKHLGNITIPFKVRIVETPWDGNQRYIEVALESKV